MRTILFLNVEWFYVGSHPGISLVKIYCICLSSPDIILHTIPKYTNRIDGFWLCSSSDRAVLRICSEDPLDSPWVTAQLQLKFVTVS